MDRGYKVELTDSIYEKLIKRNYRKSRTNLNNNLINLQYFQELSHKISNVLRNLAFRVVYIPFIKLNFSNLKDPTDNMPKWGYIASILSMRFKIHWPSQTYFLNPFQ